MIRVSLNQNLKADILTPPEPNGKVIIFLGGVPSYLYKNDISQTLCDSGFTVIQPFYYGTWVSGGDFNPQNCLATITDTIQSLEKRQIYNLYSNKKIDIEFQDYYLMGTSFGSVIVQSYEQDIISNERILLGGIPFFNKDTNSAISFDVEHFISFLQRGFEYVYRSENWDEWRRELNGEGKYLNKIYRKANYLFIQGNNDTMGTDKIIDRFIKNNNIKADLHLVDGGHSLNSIDSRQVLQKVISFLM